MTIEAIREKIDTIDSQILQLLNDRMEQALLVRKFKAEIEDMNREMEIFEKIGNTSMALIQRGFLEKIYTEIIRESKTLQQKGLEVIAFQGEHGAYGEMAAGEWNRELIPFPCNTFAEVFDGVGSGLYEYGIVPVENTLGGSVDQVNQLLIHTDLYVVGAVVLPVHHCLLAPAGANHRDIRTVYSHPQALSQCRQFLSRNSLEPLPYNDTAGAAKMLADKKPKRAGAIASRLAADLYHLEVLKQGIEDLDRNITRFLVLSRKENPEQGEKCSIIFATEHKAGTLFRSLEAFASRHISLTRIESIPNEPGNYAFFLDFEGSSHSDAVVEALQDIKETTTWLRLIGCYNERSVQ